MDNFSFEIVNNIKQEPEENYELELPESEDEDDKLLNVIECLMLPADSKSILSSYQQGLTSRPSNNNHDRCKTCKSTRRQRIGEHEFKCTFCNLKFPCPHCRTKHESQDHLIGDVFPCSQCSYSSKSKEGLKQHILSHSKKFSCETCAQKFSLRTRLKNHQMNQRHGQYAFQLVIRQRCKNCTSSFATKVGLDEHIRHVHKERISQCDICGKCYKNMRAIRRHVKLHDPNKKKKIHKKKSRAKQVIS